MKIKTNVRAGAGANAGGVNAGGASAAGHNSTSTTPTVVVYYVPPISRCAGI